MRALIDQNVTAHDVAVKELLSNHASAVSELRATYEADFARHREAIELATEGGRASQLQTQIQELIKLTQSAYDASQANGPKMEGINKVSHVSRVFIYFCLLRFTQTIFITV